MSLLAKSSRRWLFTFFLFLHAAAGLAASPNQLIIASSQETETFNPILVSSSISTYLSLMVNRPLVLLDADWNWVCGICETMPTLDNGGAKIIEDKGQKKVRVDMRLKANLAWADGRPVTAKDLRLGWDVGRSPNVAVTNKDEFDKIESFLLDEQDPLKFTLIFRELRYDFYQLLNLYPLPSHIEGAVWEKTKGTSGAYAAQTTYATNPTNPGLYEGPYKVVERRLGSHVTVRRQAKYLGQTPQIDKIILRYVPRSAALEAALFSGEADMVNELGMSLDQAMQFEKHLAKDPVHKSRFKVELRDGLTYEHIDLNLRNPVLRDKNVRKALVYALDRPKLSQTLFAGKQAAAIEYFHPLDVFYATDVVRYEYNPKKSAELLDAAGWKAQPDGPRFKDGKRLELTLMTTAGDRVRELVAQFIQSEYKKVGVTLTIRNEPARLLFGETLNHMKYSGLAMFAWVINPDVPPRINMHSREIPTRDNGWNGQNFSAWKNPRADELLDQAGREFDVNKRKTLMAELMRLYTDEVPEIPLYLRSEIAVVPAQLKNFRLTGHSVYSTQNVELWILPPAPEAGKAEPAK